MHFEVLPVGWVLGVRSKNASVNEDVAENPNPSTSETKKAQSPVVGMLAPTHPSVSLFQENGFEQRVRINIVLVQKFILKYCIFRYTRNGEPNARNNVKRLATTFPRQLKINFSRQMIIIFIHFR